MGTLLGVLVAMSVLSVTACTGENASKATSSTAPAAVTSPTATVPATLKFHPSGTRTGVTIVDSVIAAVEQQDVEKMLALIHYFTLPCDGPTGIGAVLCPPGQPVGSPSTVVGSASCEGSFAFQGGAGLIAQNFIKPPSSAPDFDGRLYAVVRRLPLPREPRIPGEYLIVFASGHAIAVDAQGITYFLFSCGPREPTHYVSGPGAWPGQTLLLPPR